MDPAHKVYVHLRLVPWVSLKFIPQWVPANQIICQSTHHTSIHTVLSYSAKGKWDGSKDEPPKQPEEALHEVDGASTALIKIWDFFPVADFKLIKKTEPPIDKIICYKGQSEGVSRSWNVVGDYAGYKDVGLLEGSSLNRANVPGPEGSTN